MQDKNIPNWYICPILGTLMTEPVIVSSGKDGEKQHTYQKEAILRWLKENHTDPLSRKEIVSYGVNLALKDAIIGEFPEEFKQEEERKRKEEFDEKLSKNIKDLKNGKNPNACSYQYQLPKEVCLILLEKHDFSDYFYILENKSYQNNLSNFIKHFDNKLLVEFFQRIRSPDQFEKLCKSVSSFEKYHHTLPFPKKDFLKLPHFTMIKLLDFFSKSFSCPSNIRDAFYRTGINFTELVEWEENKLDILIELLENDIGVEILRKEGISLHQIKQLSEINPALRKKILDTKVIEYSRLVDKTRAGISWEKWLELWKEESLRENYEISHAILEQRSEFSRFIKDIRKKWFFSSYQSIDQISRRLNTLFDQTVSIESLWRLYSSLSEYEKKKLFDSRGYYELIYDWLAREKLSLKELIEILADEDYKKDHPTYLLQYEPRGLQASFEDYQRKKEEKIPEKTKQTSLTQEIKQDSIHQSKEESTLKEKVSFTNGEKKSRELQASTIPQQVKHPKKRLVPHASSNESSYLEESYVSDAHEMSLTASATLSNERPLTRQTTRRRPSNHRNCLSEHIIPCLPGLFALLGGGGGVYGSYEINKKIISAFSSSSSSTKIICGFADFCLVLIALYLGKLMGSLLMKAFHGCQDERPDASRVTL